MYNLKCLFEALLDDSDVEENVLAKNDGRDPSKGEIEIYERKPEVVTRPILDGVNPMFALLDHWERKVNALENAVGDLRMEIAKVIF